MPLIQIPVGIAPCQVDDFPKSVGEGESARPFERSCKGAMYVRPASTQVMTEDELKFLQSAKQHAWGKRLLVVDVKVMPDKSDRPRAEVPEKTEKSAMPATPPPVAAAAPAIPPPAVPEPKPEPSSDSDDDSSSKRSRRRGRE